jgi:Na+/melibiose symporter-like transporter
VLVPKSKDPEEQPIDLLGVLLSIVGLSSLVYAIIEAPNWGWTSAATLGLFAASAVALGLFALWEMRARYPMLDLRLFRDRRFSVASGGMTLIFFAMFGTFFMVAQYFQMVLGYTPLESGLIMLPWAFVMMLLAPMAPTLVARFGAHRVVPVGLALTAVGLLVFAGFETDTSLAVIYASVIPMAMGMALTMTPLTTLIMASVPLGKAGVGSAMNDTTRELGGALGVAVLGSVVSSVYSSNLAPAVAQLPESARAMASEGLAGALAVAEELGEAGGSVATAAMSAFVDGIGVAALSGAAVVLVAAVISWFLLPAGHVLPAGAHPGAAPQEGAAGELVDEGVVEAGPVID